MKVLLALLGLLLVGCSPVDTADDYRTPKATERAAASEAEATSEATTEAAGCDAACVADYKAASQALDDCVMTPGIQSCHAEMETVAEKGDVLLAATSDPTLTKDGQALQGFLTDWAAKDCKAVIETDAMCLLLQTQIDMAAQKLALDAPAGGL